MYRYYLNNQEVTRKEFKDYVAETYEADEHQVGCLGVSVANYDDAEKRVRKMQRDCQNFSSSTTISPVFKSLKVRKS